MPLPVHTALQFDVVSSVVRVPLPVAEKKSKPLGVRMAAFYDERPVDDIDNGDSNTKTRIPRFEWFRTTRELIDFMLVRENRSRWFYAHAGGLADMEFVLDELLKEVKGHLLTSNNHQVTLANEDEKQRKIDKHEEYADSPNGWRIRASFSGSSAIIIHVTKGKNAWHFVDSYWLLRDKLENIGKAIGLHKGETPEAIAFLQKMYNKSNLSDLNNLELESFYRDAPMEVLIGYNKVDCEILWKAIYQFEQEILSLGGQLQQTIASTGMNLWRRSYLKQNIYTSERINRIAEESYFASRVEVLSRNASDFLMYDINSSFPYAMTFPQPAGLIEVRSKIPDSWLASGTGLPDCPVEKNIFIADVTIEVPEMELPPVPYRLENRVFFPTGKWRSWLTSTDIRLAIAQGCILHKSHEVYVFEPFFDLKGYADDIYGKRAAATTPFRKLVLKYLLNCLYGKYAESPFKQEMLINPEEIDRTAMQLLQPGVWLQEKEATITHRHVPISTHITSVARRTLYNHMKACFDQGKPPYYCDTDSVATKATLPCDEKKLGMLKLEKKLAWAEFIAPKIYRGEGFELEQKSGQWVESKAIQMTKAKGFSLGKSKAEAWDKFDKIVSGERVGIQRMIRMRELYRTGETEPVDIMVIKALTFESISKRFHYPDGETRAWSIPELSSGTIYPQGFDFSPETWKRMDTTTRSMLASAV